MNFGRERSVGGTHRQLQAAYDWGVSFTAVVMAAGQGTRMRSSTPKVLHDLCGLPMVHWPIRAARQAGAGRVIVVTSPGGLPGLPDGVETAVQPEPNGTGGAVQAATPLLSAEETVVVINGDAALITSEALQQLVSSHATDVTIASVHLADPSGYGRIVRDAGGAFTKIVETKTAGDATEEQLQITEINGGVYVFSGAPLLANLPRLQAHNAQGELYLTDLVELAGSAEAIDLGDSALLEGVNDRAELARVRAVLQERILVAHMRAGVTVINPAAATVDADVAIGPDSTLEPNTILRGTTSVGSGSVIGPNTTLIDSTVGDGSTLINTHAVQATVGDKVSVGPFAYLRPGTDLHDGSKIGTYVETKNSTIGAGTKVPHLSYIGDADVGTNTNLGAGTITANYDGRSKHRTTIGNNVKSSVDVSFVAPVTIGDNAWTGAGSVITDDVPEGALGIARPRQTTIEGYADRKSSPSD